MTDKERAEADGFTAYNAGDDEDPVWCYRHPNDATTSGAWATEAEAWAAAASHNERAAAHRLSEAAPAMLAALKKAQTEIRAHWDRDELQHQHCGMEVALDQIEAAIAAAERRPDAAG